MQPVESQQANARSRPRLLVPGFAATGVVFCALGGRYAVVMLAPDMTELATLMVIVLALLAAQTVTARWALKSHAGRPIWISTQLPYLLLYTMTVYWGFGKWPASWMNPPSWWYIGWAAATLLPLSWLATWWESGNRKAARRAVVLMSGLAHIVAANTAGIGTVLWQETEGFGFKGFPSPYHAWSAAFAASCVGDNLYSATTGTKRADCPRDLTGAHDAALFSSATCNTSDLFEPFQRWLNLKRDTHTFGWWDWRKLSAEESGDSAYWQIEMRTESFLPWRTARTVTVDRLTEHWNITFSTTALGGWKVCGITVADPITVTRLDPQATPSTPTSAAPKAWDPRVRFECLPSAAQSPYRRTDCATPPPDWAEPGPYQCAPDFPAILRTREWREWCAGQGWYLPER